MVVSIFRIVVVSCWQAEVDERIQELKEQLQWTHEQQMAEVQHDHSESQMELHQLCLLIIAFKVIIAFKGAIRDFLQSPHSAANCLQHARSSGPGAIVCKSRATHRALITCNMSCYVPHGTKGQLSY